ncbi:MAG: alpha/beta hydrolase [Spirochaetales bacterium]|nr:alpha/beta hydrolase [Spirochaetales bacterium]
MKIDNENHQGGSMAAIRSSIEIPNWQRQVITTPDTRDISVLVKHGSGPQLIYVPGTWSDAVSAIPFLSYIDSDFSIAVIDMPGHGESSFAPLDYSIETLSADVLSVADAVGVKRFAVSGHSLGAMTSIDIIKNSANRLICSIPIEGWTSFHVQKNAFGNDNAVFENSAIAQWLQEDEKRRLDSWLGNWTKEQRQTFGTMWRRWNGYEILVRAGVPVLEIWGDRGRPRPTNSIMEIPENTMIKVHWVANASHKLTVEKPEEVAGTINDFISCIEKGKN